MSPIPLPPLPQDTARAAESLFARDHPYLGLGRSLPAIWKRLDLLPLESADRPLADSFYPYALATLLQYWEGLTDRQMSQATGARVDLKYAMHLPLRLPGLNPEALCAFRRHLLWGDTGRRTLQALLDDVVGFSNPQKPARQVNELLSLVCLPSRVESIVSAMSEALEALAALDPAWLGANMQPHWYKRYGHEVDYNEIPQDALQAEEFVRSIGADGQALLQAIQRSGRSVLAQLPEILALRREWRSQFETRPGSLALRAPCADDCPL